MAENVIPVSGAEESGNTEMDNNGPSSSTDYSSSGPVQFTSSSGTNVIKHPISTLEVHVDEATYQIVEELGTRQVFASIITPSDSTAVMEQGSAISYPTIVQDNTTERQNCSEMDLGDPNGFMEQEASSNNLLVVQGSTADSQACAANNTEESTAVMHMEQESSVNGRLIEHLTEQVETVTYEIHEQGTIRARNKLVDSNGYTYNIRTHSSGGIYWQCTVRPKSNRCKATVVQRGDSFHPGKTGHNHPPKTLLTRTRTKIAARVKQQAVSNPFKSTTTIVNEVLLEEFGGLPAPDFLKPRSLARNASRARQSLGLRDPTNLAFELDDDRIPVGFLRGDIVKQGRRYLVFATEEQIRLLSKAKSWYIDETSRFYQEPFKKLLTISAFVTADGDAKQVPLVFALMSGSERKDYRKVIKKILDILPSTPSVREVTVFFEEGLWDVLRRALPEAKIRGCVLNWMQAAYKAIEELKLQNKFHNDNEINLFLRKVMALPFLPEEEIQPMFVRLWVQASTASLQLFIQCISTAWIYNTTWPPSTWSMFNTAVRTHRDAERWHLILKRHLSGKKPMPLYLLINLLYQEASELTTVHVQLKPLSEKKLKKIRIKGPSSHPAAKFFHYWEEYRNKTKSVAQLLKACSDVTGLISFNN